MADYTVKLDVGNYTHVLDADLSQSQANNSSTISWTYYVLRDTSAGNGAFTGNAVRFRVLRSVLADAVYDKTYDFRDYQKLTIASGSYTLAHNSAGDRTITIGFDSDSGSSGYFPAAQKASTFALPRIAQAPPAPSADRIDNVKDTSLRLVFTSNGNGGSSVLEWQAQRATNSTFTAGVQTIDSEGYATFSGLANHTRYYVRARGRNAVGWSDWSNVLSDSTYGNPSSPQGVDPTPSTNKTGRIVVTWDAPSTPGEGGVTGYNIFRDGSQIGTITGTSRTYTDDNRTPYTTYSYAVAARNKWSDSIGSRSPVGGSATAVAPGPPTAPRNLTATSSSSTPGQITLSWLAPFTQGPGGITGYTIRYANNTLVRKTTGTGTSAVITGLTPGLTYTFKIHARNALADAEGSESVSSNQYVIMAVGEPPAPTGVSVVDSSTVAGRLSILWSATGADLSGYNIFRRIDGADTLIDSINPSHTRYDVDGLTPGETYTFVVRARSVYTDTLEDGYPGSWGGPASAARSGTPRMNFETTVPSLAVVTSATNALFAGTYDIAQVTATTIQYLQDGPNVPSGSAAGTVSNNTNPVFNGTYTITTPSPTTVSYAKTAADVEPRPVSIATVTNTTNESMNGTVTVTAVNVGANLLSYAKAGSNVTSVTVPVNTTGGKSIITNLSNAVFNGVGKTITAITEQTFSYAQTNADIAETNAAGTVTNTTNRDSFNGRYKITAIPEFNIVQYRKVTANIAKRIWLSQIGDVSRYDSPSTLDVRYRSGWAG